MAKRFADTDKYKKRFIRTLPAAYKILWDYICLDCNHAGIWHVDFDIAQICVGKDAPINEIDALKHFNSGDKRIVVLNGGSKWLIKPFLDFQYGDLNRQNRVHSSVIDLLEKEGFKGLASPLQGAKDKDKDKYKEKDKENNNSDSIFLEYWKKYPVSARQGKNVALKRFLKSVKTEDDIESFKTAFNKYMDSSKVKNGFILRGSKWFDEWQDWVDYVEPEKTETKKVNFNDLDRKIASRLGKIATEPMIIGLLEELPENMWWKVDKFLKDRYRGSEGITEIEAKLKRQKDEFSRIVAGI